MQQITDKSGIYASCHLVGGMTADWWARDPQRMAFVAARYKHTAALLSGKGRVLEVGCADGFFSRIVRQRVASLTAIDNDAASIAEALAAGSGQWPVEYRVHDFLVAPLCGFDAVYALDVFEHIADERRFLEHLRCAAPVAVVGAPSLESQVHASALSRAGHVNCKSGADFRAALQKHWGNVFLFSMSDETLHTGFPPMAQYLLALCVG